MNTIKIALVATAIACLTIGTRADAQEREAVHARVSYADLNLSTAAGIDRLNRRIASGIRTACGEPTANLAAAVDVHRCIAEMRADVSLKVAGLQARSTNLQVADIGR